jgi:hypothetical protein
MPTSWLLLISCVLAVFLLVVLAAVAMGFGRPPRFKGPDRRKSARFPLHGVVDLYWVRDGATESLSGRAIDVGLNGASLLASRALEEGTMVFFAARKEPFCATACVRRATPSSGGIILGLQFKGEPMRVHVARPCSLRSVTAEDGSVVFIIEH